MREVEYAQLAKASFRAGLLSILGFLIVVASIAYSFWTIRSLDAEVEAKKAEIENLNEQVGRLKATIGDLTPTSLTIFTLNDAQQQEAEKIKALFVLRGVKVISIQKNTDPTDRPYTTEVRYYNYPADIELAQSICLTLQKDLKIIRSRISLVIIDKRPKGTIDIYLQAP